MGHLYRKPGRTIWNLKYYQHGKAIYESAKTPIKDEATKLLRRREGAIAAGEALNKPGRLRVKDALDDVARDYRINSRASLSNLEYRIRLHLLPALGHRWVSTVTAADVAAYVDDRLATGAEPSTVNRELAILKRAFTLAMRAGAIATKPHIPALEERNVRSGFFEREDLDRLCTALPARLVPVVHFAYITGWRIRSEVLPLTWAQVDGDTIRLAPETTKNREGRVFPYTAVPALVALIEEQRAIRQGFTQENVTCDYVFPNRAGKKLSDWYAEPWRAACQQAGLAGKIPHDFRRTAVRNLVRAGVSEKTAMLLTGHKTRSVFDRYDIVTLADLTTAAAKLRV